MEAIMIPKEQLKAIINSIELIKEKLDNKEKDDDFIDNQDFLIMMKVSKRTAQAWRDRGLISYSIVGGKIYYKRSDIQEMLKKNYIRATKTE